MSVRTYIRTLFNDIFCSKFFVFVCKKIVNFYCKLFNISDKPIKFGKNMSIMDIEESTIHTFQSVTGDRIDRK